jgi:hypothetical protein
LLSLDPAARSSVIDRGIPIEEDQYDYSNLIEDSIQNYEESKLKLSLPEDELTHEFNPEEENNNEVEPAEISLEPSGPIDGNLMSEDLRVINQEERRTNDAAKLKDSAPKVRVTPELVIRKSERPRVPKFLPSMLARRSSLKFQISPQKVSLGVKVGQNNNLPKSRLNDIILSTIDQLVSKNPIVIATDSNQIVTLPQMDAVDLTRDPDALVRPPPIKYLSQMNLHNPETCLEALSSKEYRIHWYFAIKDELDNLQIRNTWIMIDTDKFNAVDLHAIKSKYAFRLTVKPDGFLKFRSRLVACGYSQVPGFDYDETFAPTAKYKSLCIIFHLTAIFKWFLSGMDVANAYVEAEIDKLIHMKLPRELFSDARGNPIVVKLLKSLYGLKQAGELWNRLLNKQFCDLGYHRLAHDQCVYIKRDRSIHQDHHGHGNHLEVRWNRNSERR